MNTMATRTSESIPGAEGAARAPVRWLRRAIGVAERIPHDAIALLARFSIAAVFWSSAQTKVQGFAVNFIEGDFALGWPRLSDSALALFRDEYRLPLLPPELAAPLAAVAEHVFALGLLLGFATRLSALGLLVMTAVIQVFVYPGAYATHGTWAALLMYLLARGPGAVSIDRLIERWHQRRQAQR